jgi:hypothetical protein
MRRGALGNTDADPVEISRPAGRTGPAKRYLTAPKWSRLSEWTSRAYGRSPGTARNLTGWGQMRPRAAKRWPSRTSARQNTWLRTNWRTWRNSGGDGPPTAAPSRGGAAERDAESAAYAARGGRATVSAAPEGAIALSPKNPFDDPKAWASPAEAANAINAYRALPEGDRRAAVAASYKKDLVRVLAALSAVDQVQTFVDPLREITRWVEEDETRASAKMSDDDIAAEQAKFQIKQAADDAKAKADAAAKLKGTKPAPPTAAEKEQARKDAVASTSLPQTTKSWWDSLSPAQQKTWTDRGNAAIAKVVSFAQVNHPELKITAANFNLDFKGIENVGATAVAAGSPAIVGKNFVVAAELNPAYVMDVVVHEIFGHPEYGTYGTEYHFALYDKAEAKIPGYVKPAEGTSERKTERDAFAYQETEIFAVLRSMPFRTSPTAADAPSVPNLDTQALIDWHIDEMKKQWSPTVIVPLLRGLRMRLVIDPRIRVAALAVFDKAVAAKFDAKTRDAVKAE